MMANQPLTPEDFYAIELVSDPRLSPDGQWIAFVRRSVDRDENVYRSAIWLVPVAGGPARWFTSGTHRDQSPRWSPDGRQLAFLSDRAGDKAQLYLIPVDGGEARQVTRLPGGVLDPAWSPDGTRIAFLSPVDADERAREDRGECPPSDPDERKLWEERHKLERERKEDPRLITRFPYRVGTRYLGDRYPHLYVVDVEEREPRRITEGDRVYGAPQWMPDGQSIVTTVNRDPESMDLSFPTDVVRIPAAGGEPHVIAGAQQPGSHHHPQPSPDGQWVAYLTFSLERMAAQNHDVAIVPAAGGGPRLLTTSLDARVTRYCWSVDSQGLYLTFGQWGNVGIHHVSLDGQAERVVAGDRVIEGFDVGQEALAFVATAPDIPSDLYVADLDGGNEVRCTEVNAALLSERWLSTPQEIRYTRPDGTQIQGWIMHPPDFDPALKYPLALEIHGGPHAMWGNTFWHEFQVIAGRGYVVFFCNPRGSDGYGLAFRDGNHARWGESDAGDILAGVNGLIGQGYVDEQRMAITGGSYGGFMTAWIIGHDSRFKAAVSQRGVYELIGFYGLTDIPRFLESEFDTTPWQDAQTLWQYSPLAYVEQIETPLLILHSERDYRVPIPDGEMLYAALKRLNKQVSLVRYPREGHELSRSGEPRHRVDRIHRIVDWFDRYVET